MDWKKIASILGIIATCITLAGVVASAYTAKNSEAIKVLDTRIKLKADSDVTEMQFQNVEIKLDNLNDKYEDMHQDVKELLRLEREHR
jgi:hypothetical protein